MKHRRTASRQYHDRVAGGYDAMYEGDPYWQFYDEITWTHLRRFLPKNLGTVILDAGCGTGKWGLKLAKSGYRVILSDNSTGMLERAAAKAEELGVAERVTIDRSDLADLGGITDGAVGMVVAQGDPLSLVSDARAAVRAMRRVLLPGGTAVCSVDNRWAGVDHYVEAGIFDDLDRFLRNGQTNWFTKREEERFPVHMFWPDELVTLFEGNGFEVLEVVAKGCLVRDRNAAMVRDPELRRKLVRLELKLGRQPSALGRSSHLQIAARRR
ncbi:methyltransferase domain-containing protein [bacterium]|nr:methyltransferase domain-containing protein [candidate division CSSED10-310 bacterium]